MSVFILTYLQDLFDGQNWRDNRSENKPVIKKKRRCMGTKGLLALGLWLLLIYKGDASGKLVINRTINLFFLGVTDNYNYISYSTVIFFIFIFSTY